MHLKMASFMFLYAFYHSKKIARKNTNLIMLILSLRSLHRFPITPEACPSCSLPFLWPHFRILGLFAFGFQPSFPQAPKGMGQVSHLPQGLCTDCSFGLKTSCFTLCISHGTFHEFPNHVKAHIILVLFLLKIGAFAPICEFVYTHTYRICLTNVSLPHQKTSLVEPWSLAGWPAHSFCIKPWMVPSTVDCRA